METKKDSSWLDSAVWWVTSKSMNAEVESYEEAKALRDEIRLTDNSVRLGRYIPE